MPHLSIKEEDVIRLVLEFLSNRELSITQLSLERETGVINGVYSDDLLFLRQLILDGQWDDVLEFIQPLSSLENFDYQQCQYIVLKHKFIELLCIRSENSLVQNFDGEVEEVVKCLNELEKICPTKEEYNGLCLLLTLPKLSDHLDFKNWNPSNARVTCFKSICPLVEKFLPLDKKSDTKLTARNDRLVQLIIKGIMYESSVNYCQDKATAPFSENKEIALSGMLSSNNINDSDTSLLSWLQCIPPETFSYPFEQKTLSIDVEKLIKPSLEASWSEQILATPIKPKMFPHSATPYTRLRAVDFMSKSLTPNLDVLGLNKSLMTLSLSDITAMSRSFAGFHLTGRKAINTSVDKLFEEGDVFSTSLIDLCTHNEKANEQKDSFISPKVSRKSSDSLSIKSDDSTPPLQEPPPNIVQKSVTPKPPEPMPKPIKEPLVSGSPKPVTPGSSEQVKISEPESKPKTSEEKPTSDLWKEFHQLKKQIADQRDELYRHVLAGKNMETPDILRSEIAMMSKSTAPFPSPFDNALATQLAQAQALPYGARNISPLAKNGSSNNYVQSPIPQPNFGSPAQTTTTYANQSMTGYSPRPPSMSPNVVQMSQRYQQTPSPLISRNPASPFVSTMPPQSPLTTYESDVQKPHFIPVTTLEDAQAIRAAEFHPSGRFYGIGSNSKTLRICSYPQIQGLKHNHIVTQPVVLFKKLKHHKGSIYCLSWNNTGNLLATGSNDKTVKLMKFNSSTCAIEGSEAELTMHDGTIRDLCFVEDSTSKSGLLVTGGAGDCKIYVTDCETSTPFQALSGHSGHVLSLHSWGGAMFISGSQDRTVRFWDLRTRGCVNILTFPPNGTNPPSPVVAVCVDPTGRLMVTGHEDSYCMLYDVRGGRIIQCIQPHTADVRTIRFSHKAYYLLTGSYDHRIVLTDLQGDLTQPLPSVVVAEHSDKVIQGRWHPHEFSFLSTSADKTATLWAIPSM